MRGIVASVQPDCWGDFIVIGLFILAAYICELEEKGFFDQLAETFEIITSHLKGSYICKRNIRQRMRKERKRQISIQKRRRRRKLYKNLKRIWCYDEYLDVQKKDMAA